jgi:hypothetical protein
MHLLRGGAKLSNLELKTRPKQILGYIPMAFAHPGDIDKNCFRHEFSGLIS